MFKVRIFKTKEGAKEYANKNGYLIDNSDLYKNESAACFCGETEVVAFSVDKTFKNELILAVCEFCGEEY